MFDKMFNVCYTSLHHSVIAGVHFFGEMKDLITYFTILSSSIFLILKSSVKSFYEFKVFFSVYLSACNK